MYHFNIRMSIIVYKDTEEYIFQLIEILLKPDFLSTFETDEERDIFFIKFNEWCENLYNIHSSQIHVRKKYKNMFEKIVTILIGSSEESQKIFWKNVFKTKETNFIIYLIGNSSFFGKSIDMLIYIYEELLPYSFLHSQSSSSPPVVNSVSVFCKLFERCILNNTIYFTTIFDNHWGNLKLYSKWAKFFIKLIELSENNKTNFTNLVNHLIENNKQRTHFVSNDIYSDYALHNICLVFIELTNIDYEYYNITWKLLYITYPSYYYKLKNAMVTEYIMAEIMRRNVSKLVMNNLVNCPILQNFMKDYLHFYNPSQESEPLETSPIMSEQMMVCIEWLAVQYQYGKMNDIDRIALYWILKHKEHNFDFYYAVKLSNVLLKILVNLNYTSYAYVLFQDIYDFTIKLYINILSEKYLSNEEIVTVNGCFLLEILRQMHDWSPKKEGKDIISDYWDKHENKLAIFIKYLFKLSNVMNEDNDDSSPEKEDKDLNNTYYRIYLSAIVLFLEHNSMRLSLERMYLVEHLFEIIVRIIFNHLLVEDGLHEIKSIIYLFTVNHKQQFIKAIVNGAKNPVENTKLMFETLNMNKEKTNSFIENLEQEIKKHNVILSDYCYDIITGKIIEHAVELPSSRQIIDIHTIASHLLINETDPFNRQPLLFSDIIDRPDVQLKIDVEMSYYYDDIYCNDK